jgi:hypothetical protein
VRGSLQVSKKLKRSLNTLFVKEGEEKEEKAEKCGFLSKF